MTAISTDLASILKSLAQSLRVSSAFPATVFVWVNVLFVLPRFMSFDPAELPVVVLILTAILVLSYILYAFNVPLIRLAEGYSFQNEAVGQILYERQRKRYKAYRDELRLCEEKRDEIERCQAHLILKYSLITPEVIAQHEAYQQLERWKRRWKMRAAAARRILLDHYVYSEESKYPEEDEADIIPTRLGNTIASFERYPYRRYGIQAVAMWPRLVPILQKENFITFVENEKTVFDFLLNMAFLTLMLAVELGCLISLRSPLEGILLLAGLSAAAFVFYGAAIVGAINWGLTVKVAFDLYRGRLRKALQVREPATLEKEQADWQSLSSFFVAGNTFDGFTYEEEVECSPNQGKAWMTNILSYLRGVGEQIVALLSHCGYREHCES